MYARPHRSLSSGDCRWVALSLAQTFRIGGAGIESSATLSGIGW